MMNEELTIPAKLQMSQIERIAAETSSSEEGANKRASNNPQVPLPSLPQMSIKHVSSSHIMTNQLQPQFPSPLRAERTKITSQPSQPSEKHRYPVTKFSLNDVYYRITNGQIGSAVSDRSKLLAYVYNFLVLKKLSRP